MLTVPENKINKPETETENKKQKIVILESLEARNKILMIPENRKQKNVRQKKRKKGSR